MAWISLLVSCDTNLIVGILCHESYWPTRQITPKWLFDHKTLPKKPWTPIKKSFWKLLRSTIPAWINQDFKDCEIPASWLIGPLVEIYQLARERQRPAHPWPLSIASVFSSTSGKQLLPWKVLRSNTNKESSPSQKGNRGKSGSHCCDRIPLGNQTARTHARTKRNETISGLDSPQPPILRSKLLRSTYSIGKY